MLKIQKLRLLKYSANIFYDERKFLIFVSINIKIKLTKEINRQIEIFAIDFTTASSHCKEFKTN